MLKGNIKKRFLVLAGMLKSNGVSLSEIKLVKKAFQFADVKHSGQTRKSGEPYIIHPLETAIFLAEWKMDVPTIITGLLHDVLEDTDCSNELLEKKFGKNILEMVQIVSKVSKISGENRSKQIYDNDNSEYIIRVIMSISKNLRPIIVKIADRMHNMLTITHLKREKQLRIANETFSIFANIAGRLGLYQQKTQLLDLAFSVLEPEKYKNTKEAINKLLKQNRDSLNSISTQIREILNETKINYFFIERVKGVYSVYKKIEKGINIHDVNDIFAVRIVVDGDEVTCYQILGLIHINFTFMPNTFKDYISSPKLNLYQSLHTTITYRKVMLEIQIRNELMDKLANYGIAAHWIYKENFEDTDSELTNELMFDIFQATNKEISTRIKSIELTKIFDVLLLNNNKWYVVNEGSTVLDLAFRYNVDQILYLKKVFKEGVPVALNYNPIKDDILTFEYSQNEIQADASWEEFATFEDAKKIFRNLNKNEKATKLIKELKNALHSNLESAKEIKRRLSFLNFNTLEEYLTFYKDYPNKDVIYKFLSKTKDWKKFYNQLLDSKQKYELTNYNIKNKNIFNFKKINFTNCCTKLPGMQIVGVLNKSILFIHKFDCERISEKAKKYVLEWDEEKLKEINRNYNATFFVNISSPNFKTNAIVQFITSKGFELVEMEVNCDKKNKTIMFQILTINFINLKKLVNELTYKFDVISTIKIK
ncbi:MAG: bifunctional (p)ppGpp synthetase/guanosine-3',5'-bis(diphosphate) 3'-pyrophosphohydrolase [Malacoplasma sp.]|nr:bifunctional (p)ppGpp synthetase/guanosine-3',5'-bis(diphosphate) 3'-pyrophosphohydrolase [Malacoplasma sp.]